jgi:hypothetical protein
MCNSFSNLQSTRFSEDDIVATRTGLVPEELERTDRDSWLRILETLLCRAGFLCHHR